MNFKDCFLFFRLRMKVMLRDKVTILLFITAVILFFFIGSSLFQSAQTKSKIPIGIVNLDHSNMSNNLLERIKKNPTLLVIEENKKNLNKKWKNQKLEGIFVIEKDYEKRVMSGDRMEIVSYYYLKENSLSPFLIDVLGGEMMYDICLSKGMNVYYNLGEDILLKEKIYSPLEYTNEIHKLAMDSSFQFKFQVETIGNERINNSILYIQIAFVILGMLFSFLILFMMSNVIVEKENGVLLRLKTTAIRNVSKNIGDFLAVVVGSMVLNLGVLVAVFLNLNPFSIKIVALIYLVFLLYSMEYSILFFVLSRFFKTMTAFITIGSFFVILNGLIGFLPILEGFLPIEILKFFEFFPNNWFIHRITDIMT